MKNYKFIWLLVIMGLVLCHCHDENPTGPEDVNKAMPQFKPRVVGVPHGLPEQTNASAMLSANYIRQAADGLTGFSTFYTSPLNSIIDSTDWEKSWDVNGMTVTMKAMENDTGYQWTVTLNGTSNSNVVYNDYLLMEMEQDSLGTAGRCVIYDLWHNNGNPLTESLWLTMPNGATYFESIVYNGIEKAKRLEVISNLDQSGTLDYYEYHGGMFDQLRFRAEWYADGSGQCWMYDNMGNLQFHGNW